MRVSLRIPAVSGNFGPGYGMLSLALGLYNQFTVEEVDEGLQITNLGLYCQDIPVSRANLVHRAALSLFRRVGHESRGLRIVSECNIPSRRGLGSSTTAILAGLVAANRIARCGLDRGEICTLACELGEAPDRLAAALLGGLTLTAPTDEGPLFMKLPLPRDVKILLVIPDFEVQSRDYRVKVPARIDLADAMFNMQRIALLTAALFSGESEGLIPGLEDRIHQPGVRKLLPALREIALIARSEAGLGMSVCGEGSSFLIFSRNDNREIARRVRETYKRIRVRVRILRVDPDQGGTVIEQS